MFQNGHDWNGPTQGYSLQWESFLFCKKRVKDSLTASQNRNGYYFINCHPKSQINSLQGRKLCIPPLKSVRAKGEVIKTFWCGKPVLQYFLMFRRQSNNLLITHLMPLQHAENYIAVCHIWSYWFANTQHYNFDSKTLGIGMIPNTLDFHEVICLLTLGFNWSTNLQSEWGMVEKIFKLRLMSETDRNVGMT